MAAGPECGGVADRMLRGAGGRATDLTERDHLRVDQRPADHRAGNAAPHSEGQPRRRASRRSRCARSRYLANEIGPRPGHTEAYFEAAEWVEEQLEGYGWEVTRQRFPTPAGISWDDPGRRRAASVNLIATRGDVVPGEPWLAVGAHLDTVPQAPGAEDNASGIGSLLAIAEATQDTAPGSRSCWSRSAPRSRAARATTTTTTAPGRTSPASPPTRSSLRGMVSMDRVGVGRGAADQERLRAVADARRAGRAPLSGPACRRVLETDHASSDHESFVDDGLPGVRLGGTSYGGYHGETTPPPSSTWPSWSAPSAPCWPGSASRPRVGPGARCPTRRPRIRAGAVDDPRRRTRPISIA